MSASSSQTTQAAIPVGSDAASAIANLEHGLVGDLGQPVQQTLAQLPLQHFSASSGQAAANVADKASQIDPLGLITPVINALGTLGSGDFSGVDPTQVLSGISKVVEGNSGSLQQALSAVQLGWQGESATAAASKTQAAIAHGSQVAAQADGLSSSLSSAASSVAQARQQMMDIIDEFQGTMAASDLSTPSGVSAVVGAANQPTPRRRCSCRSRAP